MTQRTKTHATAVIAITFSVIVIGLATLFLSQGMIDGMEFVLCITLSPLLGICIYRNGDITDLALAKGASIKLARAEEISEGVSELAEQMVALFEPTPVSEAFDEEAHEKEMAAILQKVKNLTKRGRQPDGTAPQFV